MMLRRCRIMNEELNTGPNSNWRDRLQQRVGSYKGERASHIGIDLVRVIQVSYQTVRGSINANTNDNHLFASTQ